MPKQIIKPDAHEDFYVEWSSVVEAPTAFGPRVWMLDHLLDDYRPGTARWDSERVTAERRLQRADDTGSSAPAPWGCTFGTWGEIYEQRGYLPRVNLRALCERLNEDEQADVSDLITPFDDEFSVVSSRDTGPE